MDQHTTDWQVYREYNNWRVRLLQQLDHMYPDLLDTLWGDLERTQQRIEDAQKRANTRKEQAHDE